MASLGHIAVGFAAGRFYLPRDASAARLAGWMALLAGISILPDADVIGFSYGVRYGAPWGHRGATHSLAFALAIGLATALAGWLRGEPADRLGVVATLVAASHGPLDTLTDGGLGAALLWPFSHERFFAPWNPIPVAPIGLDFLSARGLECALTELALFAPLLVYALWPRRAARPSRIE